MRGSALTQVKVCALGKYKDSCHAPTVEHRGCGVNQRCGRSQHPDGLSDKWTELMGLAADRSPSGAADKLAVLGQDTSRVLGSRRSEADGALGKLL